MLKSLKRIRQRVSDKALAAGIKYPLNRQKTLALLNAQECLAESIWLDTDREPATAVLKAFEDLDLLPLIRSSQDDL